MLPLDQLARFSFPSLQALADCAAVDPRVAELATSFPLLFRMLAAEDGPLERRLDAVGAVVQGRPLPDVARRMAVPICFKRIPPEACGMPLDWVELSGDFNRRISSLMPEDPEQLARWLELVLFSARICDEGFALWIARQKSLIETDPVSKAVLWPLALYYWHCCDANSHLNWLAFTPWQCRMALASAVVQAKYWFNRVKLYAYCGESPIANSWVQGGEVGPYEFVPLVDFWQIMEERIDLANCLDCYGQKLALELARLFGIRRKGRKIGALEIGPRLLEPSVLRIVQIKGPGNAEVAMDVRQAAIAWFERQQPQLHPGHCLADANNRLTTAIGRQLEPFRQACGPRWCNAWDRDVTPSVIDQSLVVLARRVGVSGWPFGRTGLI